MVFITNYKLQITNYKLQITNYKYIMCLLYNTHQILNYNIYYTLEDLMFNR